MGVRFRQRIKIAKGLYLNIGKSGVTSVSAKAGPVTFNKCLKGGPTNVTASAPGTGLSYTQSLTKAAAPRAGGPNGRAPSTGAAPAALAPATSSGHGTRNPLSWIAGGCAGAVAGLLSQSVAIALLSCAVIMALVITVTRQRPGP